MKAWVIEKIVNFKETHTPLKFVELDPPTPGPKDIIIKVYACGVCHTEIDEIEGRAKPSFFPMVPGHQVVGEVITVGREVKKFKPGNRVGAGWIYWACGKCEFCKKDLENLCPNFKATGKDAHGGYAEYFKISEDFAFLLPETFSYEEAAPLFCAGAIGYRSLKLTSLKNGENLGLVGFGASAHLVLKMVQYLFPKSKVLVFARSAKEREFALNLGAFWAGDLGEFPPKKMHAAIDTTPVWKPPLSVLKHLFPSGRLVINAIRKEEVDKNELLKLDYSQDLWLEKEIKSVANVTRKDIAEFLELAEKIPLKPEIQIYPFEKANEALLDIKEKKIRGAKVLKIC
ncbi:MAG: zinc-dependent alcohol dehydrogenase family protein [Thermodesulfobacteriaceae bacterium]|nr:zinc-dependent alcohol dehydrogenase family protein [Thermodesulfobacteriaceae bacterium]MCX8041010.1 zinc-dependent alcohol dehydrogenase family protein [Thermodesulfobacteriaceae bacterium]MDW8135249.1 zinc-dependent alcohol dehydrogenase family protein [Thermodesulfobacterium sp.]